MLEKFVENGLPGTRIILDYRKREMAILPQPYPLRQLARHLATMLTPASCLLCGADSQDRLLCAACTLDLPLLPETRCPLCGEQTTYGERCGACLKEAPDFSSTTALFRYDFPADRIIHALKYAHQLAVAHWLGELLAQHLADHVCDLIIPLPLHPERLRQRGFNQSVEIARPISAALKQPLALDALHRVRATPAQAGLPLKERSRNVRGAFECRRDLSDLAILLIDDVMTSGATVSECARVLKLHGASRVDVAVAARAVKH